MQKLLVSLLCAASLATAGCGGAEVVAEQPTKSKIVEADEAIAIIRHSFDAMGSLERLRLAGTKVKITGSAVSEGENVPFEIVLGGPDRYKLDYTGAEFNYVYDNGKCRKTIFGVSAKCDAEENRWISPVRTLTGLTFPSGDATKLNSTFRMREETSVNGVPCVVPELRPKNTNLKIRAAYDKNTGLLAQASFYFKDESDNKTNWEVRYGDWRESKKMQVPFSRTVSVAGSVIWQETAQSVDFDAYDGRAFDPPLPPTNDQPLPYTLPARRFIKTEIEGQMVELPAPHTTIGGGPLHHGTVEKSGPTETIRIIHRGPVTKAASFFSQLEGGASIAGRQMVGDPRVILLEKPAMEGDPALMIIYVEVAEQKATVKITT